MSSYTSVIEDFESIFASAEWVATGIQAYPSNFSSADPKPSEYIVLEVLPSQALDIQYGDARQIAGLLIIQIYTAVNTGSRRVYEISDLLDDLFRRQVIGDIQTGTSSLNVKGNDPDNPALFRADYSTRFSSY